MKIFSAAQIKDWDAYTIAQEPILSIDLMERAAQACCYWILQHHSPREPFFIFCGRGNNGGDGLAIARIMMENNYPVKIFIAEEGNTGTADFRVNLERLESVNADVQFISSPGSFPVIPSGAVVIDALFGTGLNKPPAGTYAMLIEHINNSKASVIAIDLPSGLYADRSSQANAIINATHTLSFQQYKLAFLLPESAAFCGHIEVLDIGLHPEFAHTQETSFTLTLPEDVAAFYRPRDKFSHKGNFGHAALFAGSHGMMGAAILSAAACLRSGAGKLSCHIPSCGYTILQTAVPEAMCITEGGDFLSPGATLPRYDAIGIGPGIGQQDSHAALLRNILRTASCPLVLDADALNTMAAHPDILSLLPPGTILTPHPGEFSRLFGKTGNDFERMERALQKARELKCYIILKGHFTCICTPQGKGHFNSTGNPGMATAGSGDVLTGIITALLAQQYPPLLASVAGVFLHGFAGDRAASLLSEEGMVAGDIIRQLPDAFRKLAGNQ